MSNKPECPICFRSCFETLLCRTPCGHKICMECMLSIEKYECPTCRESLPYLKKLIKARNLFVNMKYSKDNDLISLDSHDEFPIL